jgi:hypothetical protein
MLFYRGENSRNADLLGNTKSLGFHSMIFAALDSTAMNNLGTTNNQGN